MKGIPAGSRIRNMDELEESDPPPRSSKLGALVLASIGGACIVMASVVLMKKPTKTASGDVDPLGALVQEARATSTGPEALDVTFPKLLAGTESPTAALEAVRGNHERKVVEDSDFALPPGHPTAPPAAGDRLPVVPLPAQQILADAGKEARPSDVLTTLARTASRESGTEVEAGSAGGFQLQVSSFKTESEATGFAGALRRRGHHAYVEAADVKGRGVWYRVRVGPFKYKRSAEIYSQEFEAKERLVTFIVSPPKTKVRVAQMTESEE